MSSSRSDYTILIIIFIDQTYFYYFIVSIYIAYFCYFFLQYSWAFATATARGYGRASMGTIKDKVNLLNPYPQSLQVMDTLVVVTRGFSQFVH